ncbi:hypothetical protein SLE2022_084680 [Rubroshorea leprosula]
MFEIGVRFVPRDAELIYLLRNKISNPDGRHPLIVEADVYKQPPWCLPWDPAENRFFLGNERFYFLKTRGTGKRAKRTLDLGGDVEAGATWKPNQKAKPILDEGTGDTIGYVTSLTLIFKNKVKGDWIMHEYTIDNKKSVQEYWILCRVKYTGKGSLFMASTSTWTAPDALSEMPESVVLSEGPDSLLPLKRQRTVELETGGLGHMEGSLVEGEGADDTELDVHEIERMLEQSDQEEEERLAMKSLVDQLEQPLEESGDGDHQGLVEENFVGKPQLVDDQAFNEEGSLSYSELNDPCV